MISLTGATRSNLLAKAFGATRRSSLQVAFVTLFALASAAQAQLTFNYDFSTNTNITDFGQLTDTRTLGGLSAYSNVTARLNLTSPVSGNPMYLGDMYSSFTRGGASGRTAVLLNRPGVDNMNPYGSVLTSFNATIDDSAAHNIFYANTYYPTETRFQSDGRSGVNPYGSGVAFSPGARDATLSVLNDSMVNSDSFSLLVADTVSGGQARLNSWGSSITGTAASSGTVAAGTGGTLSIDDGGVAATNTLGATITTTQNGGGALVVTLAGTTTFGGNVTGSGALQKEGNGTLILSHSAGNDYSGNTTINAGTLLVNNASNSGTGTGAVTVNNSGSLLGGTGSIIGAVMVNSGAMLRGGDGSAASGSLSLSGAVTMESGSIIELALGSSLTHPTLAITGSLSFASMQAFHFLDFGATTGTYDNIITGVADPGMGIPGTWMVTNSGWAGIFMYDGSNIDLVVTAVPEPGTWAAGILAAAALGLSRWKRFAAALSVWSNG